jgi:hypothetical protein
LRNVYELDICTFKGTSLVGLENIVKLDIRFYYFVHEIKMLKIVRVLKLDGCPLITYFTGLNVFKDLTTGFIKVYDPLRTLTITSGVETFSRLETLVLWGYSFEETTETTLNDSSQLSWNHLVNIRHLTLLPAETEWEKNYSKYLV